MEGGQATRGCRPIPQHRTGRSLFYVPSLGYLHDEEPRIVRKVDPFWYAALREMRDEELIDEDDYEALILLVML